MKRLMFVACLVFVMGACQQHKSEYSKEWEYYWEVDKMTSDTIWHSIIYADKELNLQPPYGNEKAWLDINYFKDYKNSITLNVTKGQIIAANNPQGGYIRARFDNDPPVRYYVYGSKDFSTEKIFISNPTDFMKRVRASKHLILDVLFFQDGEQYIEFDTKNLKW